MTDGTRALLLRQLDTAGRLASLHLDGVTTAECLWRPTAQGLHVALQSVSPSVRQSVSPSVRQSDGRWRGDWPDHERYDLGPPSIAWLTWHIGFWWSMVMDHSFGAGTLDRHDVCWPGDADATRRWIAELHDRWRATPQNASSDMLGSTEHTRWPFRDRPFTDLAAWANMELTKNSAATPALLRLPVPWSC